MSYILDFIELDLVASFGFQNSINCFVNVITFGDFKL